MRRKKGFAEKAVKNQKGTWYTKYNTISTLVHIFCSVTRKLLHYFLLLKRKGGCIQNTFISLYFELHASHRAVWHYYTGMSSTDLVCNLESRHVRHECLTEYWNQWSIPYPYFFYSYLPYSDFLVVILLPLKAYLSMLSVSIARNLKVFFS